MKFFVVGASGLVGGAFSKAAALAGHDVTGTVGKFSGELVGVREKISLELTDFSAVRAAILHAKPDAIINTAAISEPAQCEAEPARSHQLNVELPAHLAHLARELGARLIHLSSEQAFAGDRPPYSVTDPVAPINLYARQKVESEQLVHTTAPQCAVTLRAPLLMGNSPGGKRSLHERLLADWAAGKTPKLYVDEFRQTCTAENLALAMLELTSRREITGIFHWAGAELLSRYELGLRLRAHFGLAKNYTPLIALTRAEDPLGASKRQANLALDLRPLSTLLATPVENFATQLAQLIIPPACATWCAAHQENAHP